MASRYMLRNGLDAARSGQVIFVGGARMEPPAELAGRLRDQGFLVTVAPSSTDLPALLEAAPRAVVVALAPDHDYSDAHQAVRIAGAARRRSPVVVLCEECDLGAYYSLMREGALEFYDFSEAPERIAQGVSWAAYARAG